MVKIIAEPYGALPCELKTFSINGTIAMKDDFGENEDTEFWDAEPYSCVCNEFVPNTDEKDINKACDKYHLTLDEYNEVIETLESVLYVGSCGWCV